LRPVVPNVLSAEMFVTRALIFVAVAVGVASAAFAAEKTTAVWADGHTSALSDEELIGYALASPAAGYPEEAREKKITGSGVYELKINRTGATTSIAIVKSSGSRVLDTAAITAFKKWRFRPRTFQAVRIPVSWAVNRVR
jgi:TonB family protein